MSAEITIRLVESSDGSAPPSDQSTPRAVPGSPPSSVPSVRPVSPQQSPEQVAPPSTAQRALDAGRNIWNRIQGTAPGRAIGRAVQRVRRVTNSRAGRAAGRLARRAIGRISQSRVAQRFARSRAGRTIAAGAARVGGMFGRGVAAGVGGATPGAGSVAALALPVAAVATALVAAAATVKAFDLVLQKTANDIERFSPEVAMARSMRQARAEINMLDRAQRLGPGVARIEEARGKLDDATTRLWTRVLELLIKFEPIFSKGLEGVTVGVESLGVIISSIESVIAMMTIWDPKDDIQAKANLNKALQDLQKSLLQFSGAGPQPPPQPNLGWLDPDFQNFINPGAANVP